MLPGSRFIHARRHEQYCAKSCAYKNGSPYEIRRQRLFARSPECCVIQSNLRQAMPFFVEAGFNLYLIARIGSVWLPIMRGCPTLSSLVFERVGPSAVRFFTSELVPWSCPPPPRRPSSPISPCKSRHQCPQVDRLLPPPSRQNNPAQPPRVLFLFQVTPRHWWWPSATLAPGSFLLSQTTRVHVCFGRTSCRLRPSPWRISLRLYAPSA